MSELELTRSRGDRRLYVLEGVGTLRLEGWTSSTGRAEAEGDRWTFRRTGLLRRGADARDAVDEEVGGFHGPGIRRGGRLVWRGRELELRPTSAWRARYALTEGGLELAELDGRGWGKRPVRLSVAEPGAIDPGLLLFAIFIVHVLASDDQSASAGAASGAAVSGG